MVISPQFIMGRNNVLVDALSRQNQILGSEWTLKQEVFRDLCKRWPVSIDLFATSQNHRFSIYFSPYHDHNALGTDALLQNWNGWQAYAFPPWSLIPAVLKNLRSSSGVLLTIIAPYWPQRPWFPDLLDLVVDGPVALPQSRDLLRQPHFIGSIWECPGCCFMLGDYQAIHPCRWILRACSVASFLSTSSILACRLPIQVACLWAVVSVGGSFDISSLSCQDS